MVGVAIAGAAVVGAGSSMIAGSKAAKAQKQAAQTAADASNQATQAQVEEARRQYDLTRSDYAPQRAVGQSALYKLADMYGVSRPEDTSIYASGMPGGTATTIPEKFPALPPGVPSGRYFPASLYDSTLSKMPGYQPATTTHEAPIAMTPGYGGYEESPGYQWQLDQGLQAIDRQNAARGILNSGGADKARMRYATGLASGDYETFANRLAALAGVGQTATAGTAAAGASSSGQIINAYGQNAQNIGNAATAAGNARASSYANTGASISGTASNLAGMYMMSNGGFGSPKYYGVSGSDGIY